MTSVGIGNASVQIVSTKPPTRHFESPTTFTEESAFNGDALFKNIPLGQYDVHVEAEGYASTTIRRVLVSIPGPDPQGHFVRPHNAIRVNLEAEETGRFITAAEGLKIVGVAKEWAKAKVPYLTGGKTQRGADCSGTTWKIYEEAGFSYGSYQNTASFRTLVNTENDMVMKGKHFKKVSTPQVGDIGWWDGHMVIYDPALAQDVSLRNKPQPTGTKSVWSASSPGSPRPFGPAWTHWFKNGTPPVWYRYFKAAP